MATVTGILKDRILKGRRSLRAPLMGWLLLMLLSAPLPLWGDPLTSSVSVGWTESGEQWRTWQTAHFRIHALARHEHWVETVAREAEAAHRDLTGTLQWAPDKRTHLVLTDDNDFANGWATTSPYNQIRLFLSPPDRFDSLEAYQDWLRVLIRHEYTHVLHLDQGAGLPMALRGVVGRLPLLFPHQFQPVWMIEGIATALEGGAVPGSGRGQSTLMANRMRAEVASAGGPATLSRVTGLNRDWPSDQVYLYGVFFVQYLQQTQGPGALGAWLQSYRHHLIPYWMNPTARDLYGEDFPALWASYREWLSEQFPPRERASEPGERLSPHGLNASPPVAVGNRVYRLERDGHSPVQLVRYSDQGREVLTRVHEPGPMDVDEQERVLVAGVSRRVDNRSLGDIWLWQPGEGWRALTDRSRYREARWLGEERIIARRMVDGQVELDLMDAQGQWLETLWQGRPGEVLESFAVAPGGEFLVAGFKAADSPGWQIRRFDLAQRRWQSLTDNSRIQGQPSFSPDGDQLLFSGEFRGHYDLFRLHLDEGRLERLTRSDTGAFTPVQSADGRLYYQHYTSEGYQLHRLDNPLSEWVAEDGAAAGTEPSAPDQPPTGEALKDSSPSGANEAELRDKGAYSGWRSSAPRYWLPFVNVDNDSLQLGASTLGQDALGRHLWQLLAGYDETSASAFGRLGYQYDNRYQLVLQRNIQFFANGQGEVVRARASDRIAASRLNLFNAMRDHLALNLGLFYERNSDLWRQSGQTPAPSFNRSLMGAALHFDNSERFRYSISPARGRELTLVAETHEGLKDDFTGSRVLADWREYVHLGRSHVLAGRLAGVASEPGAASLRLGGEPPVSRAQFGRDRYPLRGYASNALSGRSLALASLEWRLPLARVQRNWQVYPVGLRDIHASVFGDAARVWRSRLESLEDRTFTGAGVELTTELVVGYRLLVPVTLGLARGFDEVLGEDRFYLRTGLAF
ncbi:MAG: hypothetical protein R3296_14215 [Oleiphilaceae bacterium]|nr:hypothetical protein [Oleiphilaceae bacterium]